MSDAPQTLTVVIPLSVKKRGGRKVVITPNVLEIERRQDITLIKAVARAFRWRRMLEEGRFATLTELAAAEKINRSYLCRILRLTLLAPDIVEAILDGRQPEGMTLPGLMDGVEVVWDDQNAANPFLWSATPIGDASKSAPSGCPRTLLE
jgi:hypothetical protein